MSYTNIVLGGITLTVTDLSKRKVPSQIIQKVGKKLIYHDIPGRDVTDYIIDISGVIIENKDSGRTSLLALEDADKHQYSDGLITASTSIVPGSLIFNDSADKPLHFTYKMTLREINND